MFYDITAPNTAPKLKIDKIKKVQKWSKHPYFKGIKWLKTKKISQF